MDRDPSTLLREIARLTFFADARLDRSSLRTADQPRRGPSVRYATTTSSPWRAAQRNRRVA